MYIHWYIFNEMVMYLVGVRMYNVQKCVHISGGGHVRGGCEVSPEAVVWQLVKFFAAQEDQSLVSRDGRYSNLIPGMAGTVTCL